MQSRFLLLLPVVAGATLHSGVDPNEIVQRSVKKVEADWKAAPRYSYREHDVEEKFDRNGKVKFRSVNTYQVIMMDGSEYRELIARNDEPLTPEERAEEQSKLKAERERRRNESPAAREKRVSLYQKERAQNQKMLLELVDAFNFRLTHEQTVHGRKTWVLDATPKPGYQPKSRETKVLLGMRGKMWVDEETYQWVKVQAEVIKPVSFVFGFATVAPGTEFELEQGPVSGDLWLPKHFVQRVNANVLWLHRKTFEDDTYSHYRTTSDHGGGPQVAEDR